MKRWLAPEHINRLAADPAHCTRTDMSVVIDSGHPFVPEVCTQLWHTPVYASLHREHRLRYNQLSGLRINEYIMMLESDLVEHFLEPLRRHPTVAGDPALVQALDTMIAEERRHCTAFAALNRACRPDIYPPGHDRHFSQLPVRTQAMFHIAGAFAHKLGFALWYQMAMEESALSLARDMASHPETETLGLLDPGFVSVHREHMKDEARHLHVDGLLIDRCLASASPRRRALNARLFAAMLRGVTRPTRGGSGAKVIRQLVRDMPELKARENEMIEAILALKDHRDFQTSLFNRRIMPVTFGVFDETPEFAELGRGMIGYDRR